MGLFDKFTNIWDKVTTIGGGIGRVVGGDWTGFRSIYEGVNGLFEGKAAHALQGYGKPYQRRNVNFQRYKESIHPVGSAGRIAALGDVDNIPKWSRNQAVAMYYLNSINKITQQGSDRKGA